MVQRLVMSAESKNILAIKAALLVSLHGKHDPLEVYSVQQLMEYNHQ